MNRLTVEPKDSRVHRRVGREVKRTSENLPSTHYGKQEAIPLVEGSPGSPRLRCLHPRERRGWLTQRLGERPEDPGRGYIAGDVLRPILQGRHVLRAVTPGGDVAIDLDHHRGVEPRMVEELGVV